MRDDPNNGCEGDYAQGALSLIRCKHGELKETWEPYKRCSRFVTAFTVRTDRKSVRISAVVLDMCGLGICYPFSLLILADLAHRNQKMLRKK